ncbi:MAG: diaminopimelate epimerase, partial [Phycisphaerae bacterium]|nr:diaminopimelate epimerase [Phycisphaerae bacterium]
GSEGEMCGNGVRCVGKYAYEHGLAHENPIRVETLGGLRVLELTTDGTDRVVAVRADMGPAILDPQRIPVLHAGQRVVAEPIEVCGEELAMTCVSVGNPHVAIFVRDLRDVPLHEWGPALERYRLFPERINVHFVQVMARDYLDMLIWERGSGPTLGCGSGATAVCAAGVLNDLCDRRVTVRQPGGELLIEWDETTDRLFMTGPATEVFSGVWPADA